MRLVLVALGFAIACAAVRYEKPDATQMDWANDHQFCELYAQRLNENDTWSRGFTHNMIVRRCLVERGWTVQKEPTR